nr:dihydrofolate reductase [Burkholderia gladioli]
MAANRVIGFGKDIPWTIPGEQKRFRELTMGQLLVMGRLTFESIGRPLPGRDVVVLSSRDEALAGARHASKRWWTSSATTRASGYSSAAANRSTSASCLSPMSSI